MPASPVSREMPQDHQGEEFHRPEFQRQPRERRRGQHQADGREGAANEGADGREESATPARPCLAIGSRPGM